MSVSAQGTSVEEEVVAQYGVSEPKEGKEGSPCSRVTEPVFCGGKLELEVSLANYIYIYGLPWWLSGKESACRCRRHGFDPWVRKIPWRRAWQPTLVFLPEVSYGQRSLAGYSP